MSLMPSKDELSTRKILYFKDSHLFGFKNDGTLIYVTDKSTWAKITKHGLSVDKALLLEQQMLTRQHIDCGQDLIITKPEKIKIIGKMSIFLDYDNPLNRRKKTVFKQVKTSKKMGKENRSKKEKFRKKSKLFIEIDTRYGCDEEENIYTKLSHGYSDCNIFR
jgi:hypothetical protein